MPAYHWKKTRYEVEQKKWKEAVECFNDIKNKEPNDHFLVATAFREQHSFNRALEKIKRATKDTQQWKFYNSQQKLMRKDS